MDSQGHNTFRSQSANFLGKAAWEGVVTRLCVALTRNTALSSSMSPAWSSSMPFSSSSSYSGKSEHRAAISSAAKA